MDDAVDIAVLQQELARLEALGELDANGGLDGPRSGETNQGLRLGKNDVAERGEARRDATHRGVGEHRDEQPLASS